MTLEAVLIPIIAAVVTSIVLFAKKYMAEDQQTFDVYKFASTVIVGFAIGIAAVISGNPVTSLNVEEQFFVYAGVVVLVESVLKALYRAYKKAATG